MTCCTRTAPPCRASLLRHLKAENLDKKPVTSIVKHLQLVNRHATVKIIFQDFGNHSSFSTGLVNLKKMQFRIFKASTFSMSVFFSVVLVIKLLKI